jgi:hypothetical protein
MPLKKQQPKLQQVKEKNLYTQNVKAAKPWGEELGLTWIESATTVETTQK